MTRTYDIAAMAVVVAARSREAQGLPTHVEDAVVLDRLADLSIHETAT